MTRETTLTDSRPAKSANSMWAAILRKTTKPLPAPKYGSIHTPRLSPRQRGICTLTLFAASDRSRRSSNGTTTSRRSRPCLTNARMRKRYTGRSFMWRLAEIQSDFRDAVVDGITERISQSLVGGYHPEKRLAIHQRNYQASLTDSLLTRFPATHWLLG